ncbi:MAG TPA: DUF480 domain-containing protein [Gammaproteobacteria bacterium]|nr:DUF480 domain-containing protein [Gammaproteobacteria bacterium]
MKPGRKEKSLLLPTITAEEARIIGCLMEKSVLTPDQYPLTVNALTNACNQKSGRDPVMSLEKNSVQRIARDLGAKHLVHVEENFRTGVEKYRQRLCNTVYNDLQLDKPQFAIVCLLLLRGPQTPGELRARSGRLHTFADNGAVEDALTALIERESNPLVVKLPRTPGRKDCEYMHLFSGPIDETAHATRAQAATAAGATARASVSELAERVARLEVEIAELRELLKSR